MSNTFLLIALLIIKTKTIYIKSTHDSFLQKDVLLQINAALFHTPFFNQLYEIKKSGSGSYGMVLIMCYLDNKPYINQSNECPGHVIALKVTTQ